MILLHVSASSGTIRNVELFVPPKRIISFAWRDPQKRGNVAILMPLL